MLTCICNSFTIFYYVYIKFYTIFCNELANDRMPRLKQWPYWFRMSINTDNCMKWLNIDVNVVIEILPWILANITMNKHIIAIKLDLVLTS